MPSVTFSVISEQIMCTMFIRQSALRVVITHTGGTKQAGQNDCNETNSSGLGHGNPFQITPKILLFGSKSN